MAPSFLAFLVALGAVVLAEMGDKTQLLAIAFASKYKVSKVLAGVFIATVFNHAMAVAAGHFITRIESMHIIIQSAASLSFIFFGLWTLRGDKLDGEENKTTRFGAIATVTIAFFIAEMGDKTQLATIALAAKFPESPAGVLIGTTAGMLVADGFGIIVGIVLRKKIPEEKIKFISAGAFILFGLLGTCEILYTDFHLPVMILTGIMLLVVLITFGIAGYLIRNRKEQ